MESLRMQANLYLKNLLVYKPIYLYTASPPLFTCLGSLAASKVPFHNRLTPCTQAI